MARKGDIKMKKNMNQSKSDSVHYNLLDGAPAGAETALARFVVCKGYRPQSYQQVEEHIQTCGDMPNRIE